MFEQIRFYVQAVTLSVLMAGALFLHAEEAPPASLTLEQIWEAANERQNSIHNIRVEYDVSWRKFLDTPGTRRIPLDLRPYRVVFALDGERRYLERKYEPPKDPKAPRDLNDVVIFDGKMTFNLQKDLGASVMITPGKEWTCEAGELYCSTALQMPYTDQARANLDGSYFYPHCLHASRPAYRVLPQQEQVDGAWCHVVVLEQPLRDKIWVDPQMGCAIRKREQFENVKGQTVIQGRHHHSNFVKTDANIWVPRQFTCEYFANASDPPEYWGKKYLEMTISVHRVSINHVTDDVFDPPILPGTIVVDSKGSYRIEGDKSALLSQLAEKAKARLGEEPLPRLRPRLFLILSVLAILAIISSLTWRYLRVRSRRSPA